MRNALYRILVASVAVMSVFAWSLALASDGPDKTKRGEKQSFYKGSSAPRYAVIDVCNLWSWFRADGVNQPASGDNQAYFPKFTTNVIFQDAMIYGGKLFVGGYPESGGTKPSVHQIRVGGGPNDLVGGVPSTREGWITGQGATATAVSPTDPRARIYRIRRDYLAMSVDEARSDAAVTYEHTVAEVTDVMVSLLTAQYDTDWKNWPTDLGAPYIDRNDNGRYDAPPAFSASFTVDSLIAQKRDEPGIAGADPNSPADQVIWTVYNDLDLTQALNFEGSEPMGMEVQKTIWAYKRSDAMGNLYFQRWRLINKGGVDLGTGTKGAFYIDSMYVCQFSDVDLGNASDDLVGCDTLLNMGYNYNANAADLQFTKYGLPPPSVGYDFFAGPAIPSAADSAVVNLKRRKGFKNLGMSSFAYFSAGSPYSDPPGFSQNYSQGTGRWYKLLSGFAPLGTVDDAGQAYESGPFAKSKFPLSGDPVARTGFLDGLGSTYSFAPGDRRFLLNTGPFRMAPGDTQEIVDAYVVGLGADRLSSIAVMKFNDRFAQNTFDALFQVPKAPVAPSVKVAELDGQIVLDWGSDLQRVSDIETKVTQPGAYRFEGYNVYQLPSAASRLSEGKRVATFDTPNDPTVVLDQQFDQKSGQILALPVQFGSNSGVKRYLNLKRDYVRDVDKLYNGQEYYFIVTAYSIATQVGYTPSALESDAIILTVRPKVPFGKMYGSVAGDTLKFSKVGASDGVVRPIVIDPTSSTGSTYQVKFADAGGGSTTWSLTNTTTSKVLLTGETNQSGDDNYKMIEGGILLKVEGPPPGMKDWDIPNGTRRFTFADGYTNFEGFETTIGWDDPAHFFGSTASQTVPASALRNVTLKLAAASSSTTTNPNAGGNPYGGWDVNNPGTDANFSYGYRFLRAATAAAVRPEFAPYIVNATAGYAYQDYKRGVPFSAWNTETTPPTRLAVGHLENNSATGLVDGKWWPGANGTGTAGNSGSTREWAFVFNAPYTGSTPDAALQKDILNNGLPVMWWLGVQRRGGNDFSAGDEFEILANHVNTISTVFSFTQPATTTGNDLEKVSASKIGVFPNPYYAYNPAETNRFFKFVTFNNLPPKATFRIFNLAGQLVRTLEKNDVSQFMRWDLNNDANFPVASGMYFVHIQMPDIGVTKVLKLAVIQEQEILDTF
jgi:hypothetical protein